MVKKLIAVLLVLMMCSPASAGNKGIFKKGYMNYDEVFRGTNVDNSLKSEVTDYGDIVFGVGFADDPILIFTQDYEIEFCLDDANFTMKSLLRVLRTINPEVFDRNITDIQKEGICEE